MTTALEKEGEKMGNAAINGRRVQGCRGSGLLMMTEVSGMFLRIPRQRGVGEAVLGAEEEYRALAQVQEAWTHKHHPEMEVPACRWPRQSSITLVAF